MDNSTTALLLDEYLEVQFWDHRVSVLIEFQVKNENVDSPHGDLVKELHQEADT